MGNAESRNAGCQYEPGHVERVFVHGEPLRDAAIPWPERVQAAAPSLEKAALPFYEACRSPKGRSIANFSRTVTWTIFLAAFVGPGVRIIFSSIPKSDIDPSNFDFVFWLPYLILLPYFTASPSS